ncbi:MAG: 4'-phosphopantetheinyl transferase superfamily protein [Saprospirales bacterium]|nr:4'-phosphopantetheinyl transferase superfamily protein [Saprospirales bacterium]
MGLLLHRHLAPEGELGIWKIEETESFFLDQLGLFPQEKKQIDEMKGHRRLEWLAGRYLLHYMSGREIRGACLKDEFGKPYLEGSAFQISISHSHERVAILAAPFAVGVDVQILVDKIWRIAHKFMRPEESESLLPQTSLEHLHVYWGAKEALYKAYGRRELDFREHLYITPFAFSPSGGQTTGWIRKDGFIMELEVSYEIWEDTYVLVWAVEKPTKT